MPADNIVGFATANQPKLVKVHPFNTGQPCRAKSIAAGTLMGVNLVSRLDTNANGRYKRQVFQGNGVKTTWTEDEIPVLLDVALTADAALTQTLKLTTIVRLVGKLSDSQPLVMRGNDVAPGAGEFRVYDVAGTITLQFGTAPTGEVEIQQSEAADLVTHTGGAMAAGRPYEIEATDYFSASVADNTFLERLLG